MKKLLSALACGALLLCGGMSVARADYYEMYNPATHVEGGAIVYETTHGTLMSLKVHSGEWQDDHYRYETEASGVVRFAHDGERFIGYLHVPGLMSLENGMGYPSMYRYSMPLYEKYALSNPQGYQAQAKLYGEWILVSLRVIIGCSLPWQVLMKEATKEVHALCRVKRKCLGL